MDRNTQQVLLLLGRLEGKVDTFLSRLSTLETKADQAAETEAERFSLLREGVEHKMSALISRLHGMERQMAYWAGVVGLGSLVFSLLLRWILKGAGL